MINLKTILYPRIKKGYDAFKKMKTHNKWITDITGFIGLSNIISFGYSKVYNTINSMHSGKEDSMSYYSNQKMTDFGSGWKGLSEKILKLTKIKNKGMSDTFKTAMTAFNSEGIDLGKTIQQISKRQPSHKIVSLKNRINNPVLELHKRNIGHISDI